MLRAARSRTRLCVASAGGVFVFFSVVLNVMCCYARVKRFLIKFATEISLSEGDT